jgi:protein-tyrosine phosphatase
VIDLHSHVLPGIDDGPETLEGSLEMLRDAGADGIATVAATPHVREDYPTAPEEMERLVDEVRAAARAAGIAIELLPGAELDLGFLRDLDDAALRRFGLGGNPSLLLLEFPYRGWPLHLHETVFRLATRGFSVVLAHPERNAEVQADPERLRPVVEAGVRVQLTAASVDGRLGRPSQAAARTLLGAGLAHLLATDAHAPTVRQTGLSAAVAEVGDAALAHWLVEEVPRALLDGSLPPPRPGPPRRRRRLLPRRQ